MKQLFLIGTVFMSMMAFVSGNAQAVYRCEIPDVCYEVEFQSAGFCKQNGIMCASCGLGYVDACDYAGVSTATVCKCETGDTTIICGDDVCDTGEDSISCPGDCGSVCNDGACNGSESCSSCSADCGNCSPVCGDGTCNGSETAVSCPQDGCTPWCGDGACNGSENCSSCESECGVCPPPPPPTTPTPTPTPVPVWCGDNICNNDETCVSCSNDCGACVPATPTPTPAPPACTDGTCNGSETCSSCPGDCGACPPGGPGQLQGRYVYDQNGNGVYDGVDQIMQDVVYPCDPPATEYITSGIYVTVNGTSLWMNNCNPEPYYAALLNYGTYGLTPSYPAMWTPTNVPATVTIDEPVENVWFFFTKKGHVQGRYVFDRNGNGVYDGADQLMQDVNSANQCASPANKYSSSGVVAAINGSNVWADSCNPDPYYITLLPYGAYGITSSTPAPWTATNVPASVTIDQDPEDVWFFFTRPNCGDGVCNNGETNATCPQDNCPWCGDGTCNNGETELSCPQDPCSAVCGDGVITAPEVCDNGASNQNGLYGGCSTSCTRNAYCGDGVCNGLETSISCPSDNCPPFCGDGTCNNGETVATCPSDGCVVWCGDNVCSGPGESCSLCAGDCGSCPVFQCNDGLDNDGNGLADWPADLGCSSAVDPVEAGYVPNIAPQAQSVRVTEPNYCAQGPGGTVVWSFSDLNATDTQGSYHLQVDADPGFGSPEVNTGRVSSGVTSYAIGQGVLTWNTVYYARVMVWDNYGLPSAWAPMTLCIGPGCQPGNTSWRTPVHQYPSSTDFTYAPDSPRANQAVIFTGIATCYDASNNPTACSSWAWTFGDGAVATGSTPSHTYTDPGIYSATMYVQDGTSYQCPKSPDPVSKAINVGTKLPRWREILPWFNTPVTGTQANP